MSDIVNFEGGSDVVELLVVQVGVGGNDWRKKTFLG